MNAKNLNRMKVVLIEQDKTCKCLVEQWESLLDVPPWYPNTVHSDI